MFPKAYNFRVVDKGIDTKSTTMLYEGRRRRVSTTEDKRHKPTARRRGSHGAGGPVQSQANGTSSHADADRRGSRIAHAPPPPDGARDGHDVSTEQVNGHVNDTRTDVEDLARSMSALRFVPASVTRRRAIGGRFHENLNLTP